MVDACKKADGTSPCPLCLSDIVVAAVPQRGQLVLVGESGIAQREHLIANNPPMFVNVFMYTIFITSWLIKSKETDVI
ncbi:MAG: hypothetical protein NVSMB49_06420 [Ktedonobacteraceae bacterium]